MKKLLFVMLVCLSGPIMAQQQFEGNITWSIDMNFSDARKKAVMEETRKNVVWMIKREEQVGPEKPASKAETERIEATGNRRRTEGFELKRASMYPSELTVLMKGENSIIRMKDVYPTHDIVFMKLNKQRYLLNRKEKTFKRLAAERENATADTSFKVTPTAERELINGYNCTKYLIEKRFGGKPSTQEIWTTTEIEPFDVSALSFVRLHNFKWDVDKVAGVPLKLIAKNINGVFTMLAVSIKKESYKEDDFVVPDDFLEEKFTAKKTKRPVRN